MTFKDFFYSEELEGLFGKIKALNPGTVAHRIEKNFLKSDVSKKGRTIQRMMSAGPKMTTSPRPAGITPSKKPMTIPTNFLDKSRQFTEKPRVKRVNTPISRPVV